MKTKSKMAAIALGCAMLAVGSSAAGSVCQGTSSTWDEFVQGGCGGRGNYWGNWQGSSKRFGTYAFSTGGTTKTIIAALNSSGSVISGCIATDSTPGDGYYNYWQGGPCNNGVKYVYQAWY